MGTERRGTAIVSLYEGGRQFIYAAAADRGRALALIAGVAFIAALALVAVEVAKRVAPVRQLPGDTFGALIGGALIAWMTSMPFALLMKSTSLLVFWVVTVPSLAVVFILMCMLAIWAESHT